jgi:hypothetical protein
MRTNDNSVTDPLAIAVLVKNLRNIEDAARLIEQYGRTVAAAAVVDATAEAYDKVLARIGGAMEEPHAQA